MSDTATDNGSEVLHMSWIGKISEKSITYGNYLKVKINGEIPKYIYISNGRYPTLQYSVQMLRCGNCLELGHSDITCKHIQPRCSFCSRNHRSYSVQDGSSESTPCSLPHFCFQCHNNHRPISTECVRNKEAANIHTNMLNNKESLKDINISVTAGHCGFCHKLFLFLMNTM